MPKRFHHLSSESDFPDLQGVDVYKFDNNLDYSRFDYSQMDVQVCNVPWDTGEAHIGNRTVSGFGNVVFFGSTERRDEWLASIPDTECFRWQTRYKELHRDLTLDVPLPFDVAARFNYLVVSYHLFANDDSTLEYESSKGLEKWFYFIREVQFVAPNTTRLILIDDVWQTFIYDFDISAMILERGHAPMFRTSADYYLANPIDRNADLLCEDVTFGDVSRVTHTQITTLNSGDMWACVACTADLALDFGTQHALEGWVTPAPICKTQDGVPAFYVVAMETDSLVTFMTNADNYSPQFKQTVKGIFFISKKLVTTLDDMAVFGVTCHRLWSSPHTYDALTLKKSDFGYPDEYKGIAKLYTYPYSAIVLTDEDGDATLVRVEDTTGRIELHAAVSLVYPYISISGTLTGIGAAGSAQVTFDALDRKTFDFGGRWYEKVMSWGVPCFSVVQNQLYTYDWSTYWERQQRVSDYQTTQANAKASADTQRANSQRSIFADLNQADLMADAAKTCADRNADTITGNAATQVTANSTITSRSNQAASSDTSLTNSLSQALQAWQAGYTRDTANAENTAEAQTAAVGVASGLATSAVSGAQAGAGGGPAGVVAGAIGGLVSGAIGGAAQVANTAISINLNTTKTEATIALSQDQVNENSQSGIDRTNNQNNANTANNNTTNSAITTTSANSAATIKSNATTTQTATKSAASTRSTQLNTSADASRQTAYDNADRTAANAQSAIDNAWRQGILGAPAEYGATTDAQTATTRPQALFANIVTQSKSAIALAGDEMLRFGYHYDKQWDFDGNWCIGKHFTFWKLRDFWVRNLSVPDMFADRLRFFLFGGVTVWRKPEDIGNVSIYENGV